MKKIFFAALAVAALTVSSCGNKTNANAEAVDTSAVIPYGEGDSSLNALVDQLKRAIDSKDAGTLSAVLTNFQATYASLVKSGKLEEAKNYASQIKTLISENADAIKGVAGDNSTISSLVDGINSLPSSTSTTAEEAAAAAKAAPASVTNTVKDAAGTTKESVETKVKEKVENAKEKVESAKEKATEKVDEAVDDAKSKASKAASKAAKDLGI